MDFVGRCVVLGRPVPCLCLFMYDPLTAPPLTLLSCLLQFERLHAIADANRREQQSYIRKQQQLEAEIEQVCVCVTGTWNFSMELFLVMPCRCEHLRLFNCFPIWWCPAGASTSLTRILDVS
jgi:hypothetical protein